MKIGAAFVLSLLFAIRPLSASNSSLFSVSPATAIQGATVRVLITGSNFVDGQTTVVTDHPGLTVASMVVDSSSTLEATLVVTVTPGVAQITVVTPSGSSNSLPFVIQPSLLDAASVLEVTHFAGSVGGAGWYDGIGDQARFSQIQGEWTDGTTLFITDSNCIRSLTIATGQVTTLAGDSRTSGFVDGVGSTARFFNPTGIWGDGRYLFVADTGNSALRRVDPTSGMVTTIALLDRPPGEITGDGSELFISDGNKTSYRIRMVNPGNGAAQTIAEFNQQSALGLSSFEPVGMWTDGLTLYFADVNQIRLRRIFLPTGAVTDLTFFPIGSQRDGPPRHVWSDVSHLYVSCGAGVRVMDPSALPLESTSSPLLTTLLGPMTGNGGSLYIGPDQVSIATGQATVLAGGGPNPGGLADGIGTAAQFVAPTSLWGDGKALYVIDSGVPLIRKVSFANAAVTTTGISLTNPEDIWTDGQYLYSVVVGGGLVQSAPLATGISTTLASVLTEPFGVWGNATTLFIAADSYVWQVDKATGAASILAGSAKSGKVDGVGAAAQFGMATAIWGDDVNLYVYDSFNISIRKIILATSEVSTIATGVISGYGNLWGDGTCLYFTSANQIKRLTIATGEIDTLAGDTVNGAQDGVGTDAEFSSPRALWGDGVNLYVADTNNNTIRKLGIPGSIDPPIPFSIVDGGGTSNATGTGSGDLVIGSGSIQIGSGSGTPATYATIQLRQDGVLVSEVAIPAVSPSQSGRLYAEVGGSTNTGVAIANPNASTVTINSYFTDSSGIDYGQASFTILAYGQLAKFVNEAPFNGGSSVKGTMTFNASLPVAAIALRGFTNQRNEFLMTSLPVVALPSTLSGSQVLPHFADGGGWLTQVALVNPTDQAISGTVVFAGDTSSSSFNYSIPPRSSFSVTTAGTAAAIGTGFVRIVPSAGATAPVAQGIFSYTSGGTTITTAGIPAVELGSAFRIHAEAEGPLGQVGSAQTGLAIVNAGTTPVTVTLELKTLSGVTAGTGSLVMNANSHQALFLSQIPGLLPGADPFEGILRVSSTTPTISLLGLLGHTNERGDFLISDVPAIDEANPPATQLYFPQVVDGSGYSTEFVLMDVVPGQVSAGGLTLYTQSGARLILP